MLKLKTLTFLLLIVTALTFVYAEETTDDEDEHQMSLEEEMSRHKYFEKSHPYRQLY